MTGTNERSGETPADRDIERDTEDLKRHQDSVDAVRSVAGELGANRASQERSEQRALCFSRATVALLFLAFLASCAGDAIFFWTTTTAHTDSSRQLNLLEAAQRAWIKIDRINPTQPNKEDAGGLEFFAPNIPGILHLHIVLKNVGRDPAFNVRVGAWPIFGYAERVNDLRAIEEEHCAGLDADLKKPEMVDNPGNIPVMFPGETVPIDWAGVSIKPAQIAKYSTPSRSGKRFQLWFYGCVRYTTAGSDKPHETSFAYRLARIVKGVIPNSRAFVLEFTPWVSIPGDQLDIRRKPAATGPTN